MVQVEENNKIFQRRLEALVTATSDIVSIADYQGKIIPTFRTGNWQSFTGQAPEDTLNNGWISYFHPDDVESTLQKLRLTATSRDIINMLYRVKRYDGDWRWLEGKVVPVFDDEDRVVEWVSAVSDITDRKRAEEEKDKLILKLQERERELAASEKGLRRTFDELEVAHRYIKDRERQISAIFNNARGMIFSLDKNLCITAMNKTFVDMIWNKMKIKPLIGDSIFKTIPENEKLNYSTIYQSVLNGQAQQRSKKWESGLHMEEFFEPIKDENREVMGIAIFANDITEAKELEEQLTESLDKERKLNEQLAWREEELTTQEEELRTSYEQLSSLHELLQSSEKKFEAISISTNDAIYDWDIVNDRVIWSPGFNDLFGYDPSVNFTLDMWAGSLSPDIKEEIVGSLRNALDTGLKNWDKEYKIMQPGGKVLYVTERGQILRDEEGNPYRMVGGISNITDQKNAHEEVKKKNHFLDCVIENMPIGIMLIDKDGIVTRMNKTYQKSIGLPEDFVVNGQYNLQRDELFLESDSKRFFETAQNGGIIVNEELFLDFGATVNKWSSRNDKAWFSITVFPICDKDILEAVIVVTNEITAGKQAQEKIRENTQQIIETNKQMAEYRLMALRSVMNPHFLFNSLNSIQSFIATNDREQAINYLSLFSKLIRSVLNNSLDNTNTLSEELEILKLYMNLEKLRFEHQFTVNLEVSEEIDPDEVEIPSLILQPFVENSILHGLYSKGGNDAQLNLSFRIVNEKLLCVIEDNGIGREAALKNKSNNKVHKSVGMMLTKERIELINKGDALSVKIIDLHDAGQKPAGTRVELLIDIDN